MRIGNGAADQLQLDIYGEALDAMYLADARGVQAAHRGWRDIARMVDWLCDNWDQPDEGIWETRGGRRDFTYGRFQPRRCCSRPGGDHPNTHTLPLPCSYDAPWWCLQGPVSPGHRQERY